MRIHVLLVVAVAALGAGCGKSSSSKSNTDAAISPTSSTTAGETSATVAGGGTLPDVDHATELSTAPVPHAGVGAPPTTLLQRDLVVGTGAEAAAHATVKVQYVGANFTDGKVFDSSWSHGGAISFSLDQVVPGFGQGLVGMKIGGRRELVIPPALGYGANGSPPAVGPNETLVFVVDLVAIQ
jgi:peptidylprolyl isomerase